MLLESYDLPSMLLTAGPQELLMTIHLGISESVWGVFFTSDLSSWGSFRARPRSLWDSGFSNSQIGPHKAQASLKKLASFRVP